MAKLFNGGIPIVLDSLKQHYFIDRDGEMFKHILNFMRNSKLLVSDSFGELDLLLEEAKYFDVHRKFYFLILNFFKTFGSDSEQYLDKFDLYVHELFRILILSESGQFLLFLTFNFFIILLFFTAMVKQIEKLKRDRGKINGLLQSLPPPSGNSPANCEKLMRSSCDTYEVVALHISPDLGERILLSADRNILEEIFPETSQAALDTRAGAAWNQHEGTQIIRFPLNGFCKLNSIQVLTRLINGGFEIKASTGGGVESQQFSEYLLIRKSII